MKPIKTLLLIGILAAIPSLAPSDAAAQPGGYYSGPPPGSQLPGGFHNRQGRLTFGFQLGLGGMNDDVGDIDCGNCDYNPLSLGISGHIGGFLGPRFALMFELQANTQQVSQGAFSDEDQFLTQSAAMIAGQYWLTPQLWLKGGIGLAHLQVDDAYFVSDIDNGTALMGAIGFEVFSAQYMSIDIQGRLINGAYKGIDNNVTAGTVGVGINWF
ncbi:MAG TPA: hypothetical protein VFQ53_34855 [Kofleriaceae bacterium]|nr:hypothetical protein [Kofleriaceae bacterium]